MSTRLLTMPSPMEWKRDGEDHINFWHRGETKLGRALTPVAQLPFKHEIFQRFQSLQGFIFYTTVKNPRYDDRFRKLYGSDICKPIDPQRRRVTLVNQYALFIDALYQQIQQNPHIQKRLIDSGTMWLDSYRYTLKSPTPIKMRYDHAKWFLPGLRAIRHALIHGEPFDIRPFLQNPDISFYDAVYPRV